MNRRIILGLVFLLAGMMKIYQLIADNAAHKLDSNPIYAEIGCVIWMSVGLYLIVNALTRKD